MLPVTVSHNSIRIGRFFSISFQRTLRIPDDGRSYPLPPGLGAFPICRVSDYADRVPVSWKEHGGVFIPMYQREALWLSFHGEYWHPNALKVGIGKINALSGRPWDQSLSQRKQDYCVVPDQPWLDGINTGKDYIRQFVAMPLGMGYTVEAHLTGKEEFGGIQLIVYDAKAGRFPENAPRRVYDREPGICCCKMASPAASAEMGLGAGGKMKQKICEDSYGVHTWDEHNHGRVYVHIVNSMAYREITGMEPPSTPITARTYTEHGLPWFDVYDEGKAGLVATEELSGVKSVKELDAEKGFQVQQDDDSLEIPNVKLLGNTEDVVVDGTW